MGRLMSDVNFTLCFKESFFFFWYSISKTKEENYVICV